MPGEADCWPCVCVCAYVFVCCLYAVTTIAVVYCFVLYTQCLTVLEPCVSVVCACMYIGVCVCVNALIELNDHKCHNTCPNLVAFNISLFPDSC